MSEERDKHWLVRQSTIRLLWRLGILVLIILTLGDLVVPRKAAFGIDGSFAFYSWFGLLSCVALVLFSKGLGAWLKRRDDYYDG